MSFNLSVINDEVTSDLEDLINFLIENKINFVELRSLKVKNILDYKLEEIEYISSELSNNSIRVSCLCSPLFKWFHDDSKKHETFRFSKNKPTNYYIEKAIKIALKLNTKNIRIFSYLESEDFDIEIFIDQLKSLDLLGKQYGITFQLENEPICNLKDPGDIYNLLENNKFTNIKLLLDPGNIYKMGATLGLESFKKYIKHCNYLHFKDFKQGNYVAIGEGQIPYDEYIKSLDSSYIVSLETHTGNINDVYNSIKHLRNG